MEIPAETIMNGCLLIWEKDKEIDKEQSVRERQRQKTETEREIVQNRSNRGKNKVLHVGFLMLLGNVDVTVDSSVVDSLW